MLSRSSARTAGATPHVTSRTGNRGVSQYELKISTADRTHREPDSTHNELRHTTTRKTATHEYEPKQARATSSKANAQMT